MPDSTPIFKREYSKGSRTTAERPSPVTDLRTGTVSDAIPVEERKVSTEAPLQPSPPEAPYGIGKPRRVTIRGKISHD